MVVSWVRQWFNLLTADIWKAQEQNFSRVTWLAIRQARIIMVAARGVAEDKVLLRASALTYHTLLSVVPVAAVAFGIAKGFGLERALERYLLANLQMHGEVLSKVIGFSHVLLERTKGGVIAGAGVVLLLWTIVRVIANIERSFNDIWGVSKGRKLTRKISDYLSAMLVCPFLFLMSSTANVVLASQFRLAAQRIGFLGAISPVFSLVMKLTPFLLLWLLFGFVYIFMPNTKVTLKAGALAGGVAALIFQFFQLLYINSQIWIAKYNAIYGGFAALPLFLIWLQISWLIVLFGAEYAFALQNAEAYEFKGAYQGMSQSLKRLLALGIVHALVHNFARVGGGMTVGELARRLNITPWMVNGILRELCEARVISSVISDDEKVVAYQPARSVDGITIQYVMDALDARGEKDIHIKGMKGAKRFAMYLKGIHERIVRSPLNKRLIDI